MPSPARTKTTWLSPLARFALLRTLLAGLIGVTAVSACNVPVFRYALERWPAGTFDLSVFHRGPLSAAEKQRVDEIQRAAAESGANITITTVDLQASLSEDQQNLWQHQSNAPAPWVVLRAPEPAADESAVWAGKLVDLPPFNGGSLVTSPARAELSRRLLQGDAVVWVLVESGDRAKDEPVAVLLTNELKKLEASLTLPPTAADDPAPRSALPLRIAFSIQRLARTAAEDLFIRMLLHNEGVEPGRTAVVPVFGRGRALTALSGDELAPKIFRQAAAFLCGACSCEVKELNPGKDLLLGVRWDSIFETPGEPTSATEKITAGEHVAIAAGLTPVVTNKPVRTAAEPNPRRGLKLLASTGLALTSIFILLVGVVLLRSLRQR